MLWLCLHFRHLPMEALSGAEPADYPIVITEAGRVMRRNRLARQDGIHDGMSVAAARAMTTGLREWAHCPDRERRMLEQLATWAGQFTSRVSVLAPRSLLLEIGASLHYFGGLEPLRQRLHDALTTLGHQAAPGIAPTPTAAWLLSRHGDTTPITDISALADRLASLPVTRLDLPPRIQKALKGLGCQTIGDLRAMPRDGLRRRLGQALLETLQRAHGERADPRMDWKPAAQFRARIELPAETTDRQQLQPGFSHLVDALCGHLRRLDAGITRLHFRLHHNDRPATALRVGIMTPSRDRQRLMALLEQQLAQCQLTTGAQAISLKAGRLQPLTGQSQDLLGDATENNTAAAWQRLVEDLDNRLGQGRVRALSVREEHRPEHAWQYTEPGQGRGNGGQTPRPTWLLPQPAVLESHDGRPHYHGRLILEHGPERIESGWWDGQDVSRDYYLAASPTGERLWIFRERRGARGWYLHGLFA